jgi:hypothetical protein
MVACTKHYVLWFVEQMDFNQYSSPSLLVIRSLTIKFADSPPCACHGSSGQEPQHGLMTLAYEVYLEVLKRLRREVRRKRPEVFASNSWTLHHDSAAAHAALSVREFLASK